MRFSVLTAAVLLGGCSMTTATKVTDAEPNPDGFLVNATTTKFIADKAGTRPITFADPCRRYAVNFWAIFAKNESTLTLNENGTLSSVKVNLDSTEIPLKILDIAGKVVEAIAEPFDAKSGTATDHVAETQVFDIVCGSDGQPYLVHQQTITSNTEPAIHRDPLVDEGSELDVDLVN